MLIDFFFKLREYRVPCTLRELLDLLNAMKQRVIFCSIDDFYALSRVILVKDESHFDKFDRAFADYFEGVESIDLDLSSIPKDWLEKRFERHLSDEEKAQIKQMGGLEEMMKTLQERLKEQQERHQGGNKWIGTGGTSPYGAHGYHPGGFRIGQDGNRNYSASKVWDKREFKNLDANVELGTRNIKVALRKLRQFARSGADTILDLDDTIRATAKNAGYLDIKMQPERHNAIKVLMFFDVGGSMDPYIKVCEELFSAVHTEFKHLEYFYFHNCVYEKVWQDNSRRYQETIDVWDILHRFSKDYKIIFVGDATMGPYEIAYPGGSVEHWNEEPGNVWMERILNHFDNCIWLNPQPQNYWSYYQSIDLIKQIMSSRMYPMTIAGLSDAIKELL
ncbi:MULTISPECIES: VWA domain-containing protein [unclassified Thalassotalea]|uniref:vWA domain-containing protein n=1 Tax=unclassified Thalassotalea TaxID=2614972 RepID=UPI001081B878|nr:MULTISPECIES: VWA domain-containing protein [unclassified Thalassotalea]NMP16748.1 VWA domain-containing protein [Thalassotalea sp. Y01]QBY05588.1 VWA domain-containing protein [Thalassotalea sp. HSM 43]